MAHRALAGQHGFESDGQLHAPSRSAVMKASDEVARAVERDPRVELVRPEAFINIAGPR